MAGLLEVSRWENSTAGGIPYRLLEGYPTGSFTDEGKATSTECYVIRSQDLDNFVRESFPINYYTPPRSMPGNPYLYTKTVDYEPFIDGFPANPFGGHRGSGDDDFCDYLKITITYEYGKEKDENDPLTFVEIASDAKAEVLVTSSDRMRWESDDSKIIQQDLPIGLIVSETEWTARWPNVTKAFIPTLATNSRNHMGAVNNAVMPAFFNAEVGTILFTGISFQESFVYGETNGAGGSFEMKFLEKRMVEEITESNLQVYGHNYFYRKRSGSTFDKILRPNGKPIYPELNLNALFT